MSHRSFLAWLASLPPRQWVWFLLPMQIFYCTYLFIYVQAHGVLPPPFFYNAADTFMDFFNTSFWAFHDGRYNEWRSIYPVFVFDVARFLTAPACAAAATPINLRQCDLHAVLYLFGLYLVGIACCAWRMATPSITLSANPKKAYAETMAWFLTLLLCMPGLYALERGNFIVVAFMFLALAACTEGNWKSALFLALAINVKQYMAILWIVPLLQRHYRLLLISIGCAVGINILGWLALPDPHYPMLINNVVSFSSTTAFGFYEKVWMPTSLAAWLRAIEGLQAKQLSEGWDLALAQKILLGILWLVRGLCIAVVLLMAVRARRLSGGYMVFVCLVTLLVISDGSGGYSLLLLAPFLRDLQARPLALPLQLLLLLVFLPLGRAMGPPHPPLQLVSFLTAQFYNTTADLPLGSYLRPVLLVLLLAVVFCDLWRDKDKARHAEIIEQHQR